MDSPENERLNVSLAHYSTLIAADFFFCRRFFQGYFLRPHFPLSFFSTYIFF